ncbi:MAG: cell division protein FtsX [Oligoflexia bacterium]|nr:MAG: cell division protein FtsX [Oligoflexia bacterium]
MINHVIKTWKHHASLQLATLVVLIAGFTVITGVLTVSNNLYRILTLWGESMQMSVYLSETATIENTSAIEKFLGDSGKVDKVRLVTKDEALNQFRDQMASYAPDILKDKDLLRFIPASFQFGLNKNISIQDQLKVMQEITASVSGMAGVEEVSYGQDWVKSYGAIVNTLAWMGAAFVLVILLSAAFVMSNSIHSSIEQRREEIEVLELIGATRAHIRLPYIFEGALLGGTSSVLALGFSYGLFSATKNYLSGQIAFLQLAGHIEFIQPGFILMVVGFAIGIGALASYLCVRRINDGWAASQSLIEGH